MSTPVDRFLDLACLAWNGDDGPHRWAAARALLAGQPSIADGGIHVAAARADVARVRALLDEDGRRAGTEGGPQGWPPLLHLAFSRVDADVSRAAVLDTARLLLDAGADPNAGFLMPGLPTPFTVLTGALGGGERDQPRHPHGLALAALLLERGADPNDGQALYNRMFDPDDSHLRLLLAHGLGTGDGGPWHARDPTGTDSPAVMLRSQLCWAASHAFLDRIRLLAEHGVDLDAPAAWGRTAAEIATAAGRPEVVELLVELGASAPELGPVDALVGAALAADGGAVERIRAEHPEALASALAAHPGLVVRAAAAGRADAVALLVGLGFGASTPARADLPIDQPWETALHHAAGEGDLGLVRLLLSLGADPAVRDARFEGTPLDWARHFGRDDVVELLAGLAGSGSG